MSAAAVTSRKILFVHDLRAAMREAAITAQDVGVAIAWSDFGDSRTGENVRVTVEHLAEICHLSERTVKRSRAVLVGAGLFTRVSEGYPGRAAVYRYQPRTERGPGVTPVLGPPTAPDAEQGPEQGPSQGPPVAHHPGLPLTTPTNDAEAAEATAAEERDDGAALSPAHRDAAREAKRRDEIVGLLIEAWNDEYVEAPDGWYSAIEAAEEYAVADEFLSSVLQRIAADHRIKVPPLAYLSGLMKSLTAFEMGVAMKAINRRFASRPDPHRSAHSPNPPKGREP